MIDQDRLPGEEYGELPLWEVQYGQCLGMGLVADRGLGKIYECVCFCGVRWDRDYVERQGFFRSPEE